MGLPTERLTSSSAVSLHLPFCRSHLACRSIASTQTRQTSSVSRSLRIQSAQASRHVRPSSVFPHHNDTRGLTDVLPHLSPTAFPSLNKKYPLYGLHSVPPLTAEQWWTLLIEETMIGAGVEPKGPSSWSLSFGGPDSIETHATQLYQLWRRTFRCSAIVYWSASPPPRVIARSTTSSQPVRPQSIVTVTMAGLDLT